MQQGSSLQSGCSAYALGQPQAPGVAGLGAKLNYSRVLHL